FAPVRRNQHDDYQRVHRIRAGRSRHVGSDAVNAARETAGGKSDSDLVFAPGGLGPSREAGWEGVEARKESREKEKERQKGGEEGQEGQKGRQEEGRQEEAPLGLPSPVRPAVATDDRARGFF